jgi:hypothetical protein
LAEEASSAESTFCFFAGEDDPSPSPSLLHFLLLPFTKAVFAVSLVLLLPFDVLAPPFLPAAFFPFVGCLAAACDFLAAALAGDFGDGFAVEDFELAVVLDDFFAGDFTQALTEVFGLGDLGVEDLQDNGEETVDEGDEDALDDREALEAVDLAGEAFLGSMSGWLGKDMCTMSEVKARRESECVSTFSAALRDPMLWELLYCVFFFCNIEYPRND